MDKNSSYRYGWLLLAIVALWSCNSRRKVLPSMVHQYSKDVSTPFGTKVAYRLLKQVYNGYDMFDEKQDFEDSWRSGYALSNDTAALYYCICRNLYLSPEDREAMMNYVYEGNSLFLSGEYLDVHLLDTLGCKLNNYGAFTANGVNDFYAMEDTYVETDFSVVYDTARYGFFYLPFSSYFSSFDSSYSKVLGRNAYGQPDYLVIFYGKGRLFLHCAPEALSNYFLLHRNNYHYFERVMSYMPVQPQRIHWDDYYNKHNYPRSSGSSFRVLLQYPSTRWAFWLSLLLLLLYILFGGKRRQRIVPVVSPVRNTTVGYTETVSRLYWQKKDNKNMADKMILYFYEYIRSQFFLNTHRINNDFLTALSNKSGVSIEETEALFSIIATVQRSHRIKDEQLLTLSNQIEKFYKSKR